MPLKLSRMIVLVSIFVCFTSPLLPLCAQSVAISKILHRAIPAAVPAPKDIIGFTPGDDRKLAAWSQVVDYFNALGRTSPRVQVREVGKTTLGKPFIVATFSSPENLKKLDHFRDIQNKLADPRLIKDDAEAESLLKEGKTIVLCTFQIHSTEIGGSLAAINTAYQLASSDSPQVKDILDNCIVFFIPSLNPDGVDIVHDWYEKTLNTPFEGSSPPELYHHYTGHDNNRDWYAFTQVETQLTIDKVQNVWHPQIVHDVHQQGSFTSRLFLPPYIDPVEPNVPPMIMEGVNFMGSSMAWDLGQQGKKGISIDSTYDAWSPSRAYQHYHGGIRILSETASARLASPMTVKPDQLTAGLGYDARISSWNFPDPWPGGTWTVGNIVDYMSSGVMSLLTNSARYRDRWLRGFYLVNKDAVRDRKPGEPFAYIIPAVSDRATQQRQNAMVNILLRGGLEIYLEDKPFSAGGKEFEAGSMVIPLVQPYGGFARVLLDKEMYPDLREATGEPKRPYDVTAHCLPLLMGVDVARIDEKFEYERKTPIGGRASDKIAFLPKQMPDLSGYSSNSSIRKIEVADYGRDTGAQPPSVEAGNRGPMPQMTLPRTGLYKSYAASMDEGWTRFVFDQYKVPYTSLFDKEVRAGNLRAKYDCIILPDQQTRGLLDGLRPGSYPAEYTGGLGPEGVKALKEFVEAGGTLVAFNNSSLFAIDQFKLPVRNVLAGVANKDFYCPGSILKAQVDQSSQLANGMPAESIAWFEGGPAFELTAVGPRVKTIVQFAPTKELLLAGWILGPDRIANKAAEVEIKEGKGRFVLFAFRPQYRAQSLSTYPLVFNAIATSRVQGQ